jgi:hypothetical protein
MVCERKGYGKENWPPFKYLGLMRCFKASSVCFGYGLITNVSSDRSKLLGNCLSILWRLVVAHSIGLVQIRLISRELKSMVIRMDFRWKFKPCPSGCGSSLSMQVYL